MSASREERQIPRNESVIGREVRVDGRAGFYKVLRFDCDMAVLTTRYSKRPKYFVPISKCYFTANGYRRLIGGPQS